VAQRGAHGTPLGGGRVTSEELDLVEGELDPLAELSLGGEVAVEREAVPDRDD
jgi:hypothetical protein